MRLLMIIDSMELNGGSSMFLEMAAGLRKYHSDWEVDLLVVSKTGEYGRRHITNDDLMQSYGSDVPSISYEQFEYSKKKYCPPGTIVVHHRLGCTRPLLVPVPYVVINHTVQSPHRIRKFKHASVIVSVCEYIALLSDRFAKSKVILNGVENDYIKDIPAAGLKGIFKSGRCHRLAGAKFDRKSLVFIEQLNIPNHKHYLIGPTQISNKYFQKFSCTRYMGSIFNRQRKMSIIKDLDIYFYDATMKEGASIAILEALACGVPVMCHARGGNSELVRQPRNGLYFRSNKDAKRSLLKLHRDRDYLKGLKESTIKDFNDRLHIRHMLSKYMKIFRHLI